MDYSIHKITEFDTQLIGELSSIEGEAFDDGALNRWSFPVFIRHGAVYVLKCDGIICGIADIMKDWDDFGLAFIYNFVIKKDFRGKGLSIEFLSQLIPALAEENVRKVQLTVSGDNSPAVSSYLKAGFKETAYLRNEYGLKEDRMLLELDVRKDYGRRRQR
ncbi:MAG: GNAT family N-acetyltransferase [Rubrobacteridae bacterium]|nr:GNAT family N-acetyltransferase [Rubrobacteridae bacterium]